MNGPRGVPAVTAAAVRARAADWCEYCRMHQSPHGETFHVEHVLPVLQPAQV